MTEHKSEVARLRQQIAEEYEAAQRGLTGPAIVSRHDFITARMEGIARASAELRQLVGEAEAMQIIIEVNKSVVVEQPQEHSNHRCKEDAMEHEEHAALLSFEATTDEYSAIHHVIDCYIFYLEAALPPSADRRDRKSVV